jgi:hypothetical protein
MGYSNHSSPLKAAIFCTMVRSLLYQIRDFVTSTITNFFMPNSTKTEFVFTHAGGSPSSVVPLSPISAFAYGQVQSADNVFITRVEWRKRIAAPFHEFLVFHVKEHGTNRKTVILVERNSAEDGRLTTGNKEGDDAPRQYEVEGRRSVQTSGDGNRVHREGDERGPAGVEGAGQGRTIDAPSSDRRWSATRPTHAVPTTPPKVKTSRDTGLSSFQSRSSSSVKPMDSNDQLIFSTNGTAEFVDRLKGDHKLMLTLRIMGEYISVPQLAVLAKVVHDSHPAYKLLESQCYWYAEVIYSVVKAKCPSDKTKEALQECHKERGKFGKWTVPQSGEPTVEHFVEAFDNAWALFIETIDEARAKERDDEQQVSFSSFLQYWLPTYQHVTEDGKRDGDCGESEAAG